MAMKDVLDLRLRYQAVRCSLHYRLHVTAERGENILLWDNLHNHRNHRLKGLQVFAYRCHGQPLVRAKNLPRRWLSRRLRAAKNVGKKPRCVLMLPTPLALKDSVHRGEFFGSGFSHEFRRTPRPGM